MPTQTKRQHDRVAMIHAGTLAIKQFVELAQITDANHPIVTSMSVAAFDAIRQADNDNDKALLVGHLALACYVYGRNSNGGNDA